VTYVKLRSWHIEALTFRSGMIRTRCGLLARVAGTIGTGPGIPVNVSETAEALPLGERSCETCLRLTLHDEAEIQGDTPGDIAPSDSPDVQGPP
jgi:hypothetical protein